MTSPSQAPSLAQLSKTTFAPLIRFSVLREHESPAEGRNGSLLCAEYSGALVVRPALQIAEDTANSVRVDLVNLNIQTANIIIDLSHQTAIQFDLISPAIADLMNANRERKVLVVTDDDGLVGSLRFAYGSAGLMLVESVQTALNIIDKARIRTEMSQP